MVISSDSKHEATSPRAADLTMIAEGIEEPEGASLARASLIVLAGWEIGREIEIQGGNQILGRSTSSDSFINAPSVSRQHAQIDLIQEDGERHFVITDLGSSNGTYVNNKPVTSARLHNGDRIRMGDVLFKFALQDEIDSQFHREIHRRIYHDQLTGLLTMEAFRMRLDSVLRHKKTHKVFTIAMTDLDGLKRVNDTYGHLAGRMVVREMGAMMRACLRTGDLAGLYGGDEAIVLYPHTAIEEAATIAEQLRQAIERREFEHRGHTFHVSISQGLAEYPRHGQHAEDLIAAADRALYLAKSAGRNRIEFAADPEG